MYLKQGLRKNESKHVLVCCFKLTPTEHICITDVSWNSKVFSKKKTKGTSSWQNQNGHTYKYEAKRSTGRGWKLVLCSVALNENVEVMVSSFKVLPVDEDASSE